MRERGSVLNRRGEAVLDASIMDGDDLRVGGVAAVRTVRNPVQVARRVIESTRQVLLAGPGAEEFARQQGFEAIRPEELVVPPGGGAAARTPGAPAGPPRRGTRSARVAIDLGRAHCGGRVHRGARSTSLPDGWGDTPLPGAGLYADSRIGGVACTGWGEGIARLSMARAVLARMEGGRDPADAARELLAACWSRLGGTAGLLIVTPDSRLVTGLEHAADGAGLGARRHGDPGRRGLRGTLPLGVRRGRRSWKPARLPRPRGHERP